MVKYKHKPGTYRRVCVTWIDSVSIRKSWHSNAEILDATDNDTFYTVGYVIRETKWYFMIAQSVHLENEEPVGFSDIFKIPKGCIIKIEKI